MEKLIKEFKKKLEVEGRNYKWFIKNYLPDTKYQTFASQVAGFNPISNEVEKAIKKYLWK